MKHWIIIPKIQGLLVLFMLILFCLDMAKPGIGQFALIPSLKKSATESIPKIKPENIIPKLPNLPITETEKNYQTQPTQQIPTQQIPTQQIPTQQIPTQANCTAVEIYAGQCSQL